MNTLLIRNAKTVVTMDGKRTILPNTSIYIVGNRIAEIQSKKKYADKVVDARRMIVLPGFINTHHHFFQSFMKHVPELQNQRIDTWISIVSRLGKKMDERAYYYASLIACIELLQSGCTATTDMHYVFPKSHDHLKIFSSTVKAARELGIRFHPYRGSMSLSKKDGALFDDDVVETSQEIYDRTVETIKSFHQEKPDSMIKVGIGPCTIFTSSKRDYENAAQLAEIYNVNLQTHLSESTYEQAYAHKKYGMNPLTYLKTLGWNTNKASFVHCVELNSREISTIAKQKNSVCHCPISNARSPLGQKGIAPIWEMLKAGVNISIGVDGSAGNDSSNILEEMRWARTIQGVREKATYLSPMDVLHMGTVGGARSLRWDNEIGSLEIGKCADIILFETGISAESIGVWDEVGALMSCQAKKAHTVIVNGEVVIQAGKFLRINEQDYVKEAQVYWKKTFT